MPSAALEVMPWKTEEGAVTVRRCCNPARWRGREGRGTQVIIEGFWDFEIHTLSPMRKVLIFSFYKRKV